MYYSFLLSNTDIYDVSMLSHFSCVQLLVTLRMVACQTLLSMGFPRQKFWSELPFPSTGDLPDPGRESMFPALAGGFFITEPQGKTVIGSGASRVAQQQRISLQ